jgi:hypothetical protein
MNNAFVFVVCGSREHIDTLHYALKSLASRTNNDIIVVTDPARNEILIEHNNIITINTPPEFNHHQASIWMKTSLHLILPKGKKYAYLDTDIIAIGDHVDKIFDEYIPPIRFASDHCNMPRFSPYAVNCSCQSEYQDFIDKLNAYLDKEDPLRLTTDPAIISSRHQLSRTLTGLVQNKLLLILKGLLYCFSWPYFRLNDKFLFDRKRNKWKDQQGRDIMTNINWRKVAKSMGLKYNPLTFNMKFSNGQSIWVNECHHLQENIQKKFGITVTNNNWRHRNGGVFLFDDRSFEFLDTWHNFTLEIFKDPEWKTRDQGTLIATHWKFGIQDQPPLNKRWNFICDYHNGLLALNDNEDAISDDGRSYIKPEFLHIYHHFGDTQWDIWNWADRQAAKTT